jgi:hypothetical protein
MSAWSPKLFAIAANGRITAYGPIGRKNQNTGVTSTVCRLHIHVNDTSGEAKLPHVT